MQPTIQLPVEAKIAVGVTAAAVGTGIFLIARHLVKKGKEAKEQKEKEKETAAVIENEAAAWGAAGQQPTLPQLQYKSLADQLEKAFNPSWWEFEGTIEQSVYDAISQLKNNRDWLELVSAYGTRDGETLQVALQDELDSDEERANVNNILTSKGIVYRI